MRIWIASVGPLVELLLRSSSVELMIDMVVLSIVVLDSVSLIESIAKISVLKLHKVRLIRST